MKTVQDTGLLGLVAAVTVHLLVLGLLFAMDQPERATAKRRPPVRVSLVAKKKPPAPPRAAQARPKPKPKKPVPAPKVDEDPNTGAGEGACDHQSAGPDCRARRHPAQAKASWHQAQGPCH